VAAKKKAPAQGANRMKTFYGVLVAVAVVGGAAIIYAAKGGAAGSMATEPLTMEAISSASELTQRARGFSIGAENAPVDMRVFSDFTCPGCGQWAGRIEPMLKSEFINNGRLRLTYYDFPLSGGIHTHSFVAARAARCAGDQEKFWDYHDRLFATQQQWSYSSSIPVDFLVDLAQQTGLDAKTFESCLRSDQHADVVTANKMLGEALRVGGTPTVFINGTELRNWGNYDDVKRAIEMAGGGN
jgi:protein-disulfide isomerase